MADDPNQNPYLVKEKPFSSQLSYDPTQPVYQGSGQATVSGFGGKGEAAAMFADKLIGGISKGLAMANAHKMQQEETQRAALMDARNRLVSGPYTPEQIKGPLAEIDEHLGKMTLHWMDRASGDTKPKRGVQQGQSKERRGRASIGEQGATSAATGVVSSGMEDHPIHHFMAGARQMVVNLLGPQIQGSPYSSEEVEKTIQRTNDFMKGAATVHEQQRDAYGRVVSEWPKVLPGGGLSPSQGGMIGTINTPSNWLNPNAPQQQGGMVGAVNVPTGWLNPPAPTPAQAGAAAAAGVPQAPAQAPSPVQQPAPNVPPPAQVQAPPTVPSPEPPYFLRRDVPQQSAIPGLADFTRAPATAPTLAPNAPVPTQPAAPGQVTSSQLTPAQQAAVNQGLPTPGRPTTAQPGETTEDAVMRTLANLIGQNSAAGQQGITYSQIVSNKPLMMDLYDLQYLSGGKLPEQITLALQNAQNYEMANTPQAKLDAAAKLAQIEATFGLAASRKASARTRSLINVTRPDGKQTQVYLGPKGFEDIQGNEFIPGPDDSLSLFSHPAGHNLLKVVQDDKTGLMYWGNTMTGQLTPMVVPNTNHQLAGDSKMSLVIARAREMGDIMMERSLVDGWMKIENDYLNDLKTIQSTPSLIGKQRDNAIARAEKEREAAKERLRSQFGFPDVKGTKRGGGGGGGGGDDSDKDKKKGNPLIH